MLSHVPAPAWIFARWIITATALILLALETARHISP
jgi:hypothetical protein